MILRWVSVDISTLLSLEPYVLDQEEREGHEERFGMKSALVVKSRKSKKGAHMQGMRRSGDGRLWRDELTSLRLPSSHSTLRTQNHLFLLSAVSARRSSPSTNFTQRQNDRLKTPQHIISALCSTHPHVQTYMSTLGANPSDHNLAKSTLSPWPGCDMHSHSRR
jgi:hypothetical protein